MRLDKLKEFFKPKKIHGKTSIQVEIDTVLNKLKGASIKTLEINGINELYVNSYFENYNEYCNVLYSPENIVNYSIVTAVQWPHFIQYNNENLNMIFRHIDFFNANHRFSKTIPENKIDRIEVINLDFLKTIEICL